MIRREKKCDKQKRKMPRRDEKGRRTLICRGKTQGNTAKGREHTTQRGAASDNLEQKQLTGH